jgi:IstB-like ATP binding protein
MALTTVTAPGTSFPPTRNRASTRATIITSQLPIEHWHEWIGDATVADAKLDRLMQNHHRLTLTGESLRKGGQTKAYSQHNQQRDRELKQRQRRAGSSMSTCLIGGGPPAAWQGPDKNLQPAIKKGKMIPKSTKN